MAGSTTGPLHQGRAGYYDLARHWHDATPLAPEAARRLPETVPHDWLEGHPVSCACAPCGRFPDPDLLVRLKRKRVRSAARRPG